MNKNVLIVIIALAVIVGGYFLFRGGYQTSQAPTAQNQENTAASPQQPASASQSRIITIRNHKISVPTLAIPAGTTVTWVNEDNLAGFPYSNHSPTSGTIDPSGAQGKKGVVPNSGSGVSDGKFAFALAFGKSESFTFTEPGNYTYYIAEHPLVSGEGKIIVEESEKPISMSAGNFFFTLKTLSAKVGKKIVLEVQATGQHTFTIDELGVNVPLPHGKTTRVEFIPARSGTFTYYCAIPGHREAGQVGTIAVE